MQSIKQKFIVQVFGGGFLYEGFTYQRQPPCQRQYGHRLTGNGKGFEAEAVEAEILHIGHKAIRGCIGCRKCAALNRCVFNDEVNEAAQKLAECDGLVVATPVYYASANATLIAFWTDCSSALPTSTKP